MSIDSLTALIRTIPDFPKPGIQFRDVTTLLADGPGFAELVERLTSVARPLDPDLIVGIEARGFILGAALAAALGKGFVPVRKKGKLPGTTVRHEYFLEYGTDIIEVQADVIEPGQRVVVLDDLLATGGTAAASITLLERVGGKVVGCAFLIELGGLNGREALGDVPVSSLLSLD